MSVVHRVQGFHKTTEALETEYVIPPHIVRAVRVAVGAVDDPDEEPGVVPLTADDARRVSELTGLALDVERCDWFLEPSESAFAIDVQWPDASACATRDVEDLSLGHLKLSVAGTDVTAWRTSSGDRGSGVELPLYRLVEWIARNWWALLYEPRKGEAPETADYRLRHCLGSAHSGYVLPDLQIASDGARAWVDARVRYFSGPRLTFINKSDCSLEREVLKDELSSFVETVIGRIRNSGVNGSSAQDLWDLIKTTTHEQEPYCRFIGAMGLSPYADNGPIDAILAQALDRYDTDFVLDLCQVAEPENLDRVADLAGHLAEALTRGSVFDLSPIRRLQVPPDIAAVPWQRGIEMARRVRSQFGISSRDMCGSNAVFDRLRIDTGPAILLPNAPEDEGRISAALKRSSGMEMRVALIGGKEFHRRFSAARAVFLGMLAGPDSSRLITVARTRDQQASRAFAAETIAPIDYIRDRAGGGNTIPSGLIPQVADELNTTATVVRNQATNNRMRVIN